MKFLLALCAVSIGFLLAGESDAAVIHSQTTIEQQYRDGALSPDHTTVTGTQIVGNICDSGGGEQCVLYNGPCLWDADDVMSNATSLGGPPATDCLLSDWDNEPVYVSLIVQGMGTASLTLRFDPPGFERTYTVTNTTGSETSFNNFACSMTPRYDQHNQSPWPFSIISPGALGGVPGFAVPTTMTATVSGTAHNITGSYRGGFVIVPGGPECDLIPGVSDSDEDGDGYTSARERVLGTNPYDNCGEPVVYGVWNETVSSSWASDLYDLPLSVDKVDVQDIVSFTVFHDGLRHLDSSPGDIGYDPRWDIVPGPNGLGTWINIVDLSALYASTPIGYPPMLGGARALGGPPCQ